MKRRLRTLSGWYESHRDVVASMAPLLEALFPSWCDHCGDPLAWSSDQLGLCGRCRQGIRRQIPRCCACGSSKIGVSGERCGPCDRNPPPWERLYFAMDYEGAGRGVVHRFKFRGRREWAGPLGRSMVASMGEADLDPSTAVVPIPLVLSRRVNRGYDQAQLLAVEVARQLGLELVRGLSSTTLWRQPFSTLGRRQRHRRKNPFRPTGKLAGRPILVVDDIITTGATLRAACTCLKRALCGPIQTLVAARTPTERREPDRAGSRPSGIRRS